MSKPPSRRLAPILAAALLVLGALPAAGQLLAPGRGLLRIATGYFDIHYPASRRAEALRLASFADGIRDQLARELGVEGRRRFPLLLSDDFEVLNGFFTPYPSDRIVLYAAPVPIDGDLGAFDDGLKKLFIHELTHALLMTRRAPLWKAAAFLFGDPAAPAFLSAPPSLIEGSAVAAESADGFGRAADPRSGGLLRQALLEGEAPGFWQAAGAADRYPFGAAPYVYGGYFSSWLASRQGRGAYAALWAELAKGDFAAGIGGGLFGRGAFRAAYGLGLDEAWEAFLEAEALTEPVVMATKRLAAKPGSITAMAAGGGKLYWADANRGAVLVRDLASGRSRKLFAADGSVGRLSLSPDGRRLLVSAARREGAFPRLFVREYDLDRGAFTGAELRGLGEAAYAGTAGYPIVAIAFEAFRTDLVLLADGGRRTLLRGAEDLSFGDPGSPDGRLVYFLARDRGIVELARLDLADGSLSLLEAPGGLSWARYLSVGEGGIAFAEARGRGFYRLTRLIDGAAGPRSGAAAGTGAAADGFGGGSGGATPLLLRQEVELSGGVHLPQATRDGLYYLGRFADGEYPCRFTGGPEGNPALTLVTSPASWRPAAFEPRGAVTGAEGGQASGAGAPGAAAGSGALGVADGFVEEPAPFLPLALRVFRVPTLSSDFDSAGLRLAGADIAEKLSWTAAAEYAWGAKAANLSVDLEVGLSPWRIALSASDRFTLEEAAAGGAGAVYRRTAIASASAARSFAFFPSRRRFELALAAAGGAAARAPAGAAYGQPFTAGGAAARLSAAYSDLFTERFPPKTARGGRAELSLGGEWSLAAGGAPALDAGLDCALAMALPFLDLPVAAELHGAASLDGRLLFGPTSRGFAADGARAPSIVASSYPAFAEYRGSLLAGGGYAFAEARATLASFEIQRDFPGLPLYARRLAAEAGGRAALLVEPSPGAGLAAGGSEAAILLPSVFARAELDLAPLVGAAARAGLKLGVEVSYALRPEEARLGPFRVAFDFGAEL
ncbi:MAG: hypothetical protein JNG85_16535 [Spirochaetaceae bacterium]|nr:hypothetical protein [Spirochaetaceae bacterium]